MPARTPLALTILALVTPGLLAAQHAGITEGHAAMVGQSHPSSSATAAAYYSFGFAPGERVVDLPVVDVNGRRATLGSLAGSTGAVLIVRDAECPATQRYSLRMAELEREYGPRGFTFAYVDVTPHDRAAAKADAEKYGLTGRTVLDTDHRVVNALRARSAAEAFVIDTRGTLRYRGAIDDQFGVDFHHDAPRATYLRDAMDRMAKGKDVLLRSTTAAGCVLNTDATAAGVARPVTYHNRISRMMQDNCQGCHNANGNAPMPLENYAQVAERRAVIEFMTRSGRMPPWFAHRKVGEWANDKSLSDRDLHDLITWAHTGAPQGNPKDAPLPKTYVKGWSMGTPDAIVAITDTFHVPAQGVVEYKYSYVKTNFNEDKWVTAMEIRPTAAKAVHHVIVFLEEPGREPDDKKRKPGQPAPQGGIAGFFGATAPGTPATIYPDGMGKKLPKGAWLKFQIHYTPNGTAQDDQTRIGLMFADKPVEHEVMTRSAFNTRFEIKPFEKGQIVTAEATLRNGGTLVSLFPHMHTRGAGFTYDVISPDGKDTTRILDVPHYNFNWQTYYAFRKPLEVAPGSKIRAIAVYDNSKDNPFNPDPSKTVRFGEQTFEEMMIGYFDYLPAQVAAVPVAPPAKPDTGRKGSGRR